MLVPSPSTAEAERLDACDDVPAIGSWWWITATDKDHKPSEYDEPKRRWIGCVIEVGSNYAKLEGVRFEARIALDDFHDQCKPERDPNAYLDRKVGFHKQRVRELTAEIQKLCHQLGVPMRQAIAAAEPATQALAVAHGIGDVKAYKRSLLKAKDKTLPELFAKIGVEHKAMALWMSAELIPAKAELKATQEVTEVISDKIHTVELYAGLHEQLIKVRDGDPASIDTKVHLMQRRHYMDEECLVKYEAGGMSFKDIKAFDKWLARDENFTRLLPHDRCLLAFRIRRYDRRTDENTIEAFISLWHENNENRATFLYIRNGRQLWRMETSVEFEAELFPSREDSALLGDDAFWIKPDSGRDMLITGRQHAGMSETFRGKRGYLAQKLWQWHRAGCPKGAWDYVAIEHDEEQYRWKLGEIHSQSGRPDRRWDIGSNPADEYELLTPINIYYDDAMKRIRRAAFEHNRIAVIVQGLLDRSTCLHPHPPWRIWTPDGFAAGVDLVYDVARAITPGDAPDFEEYRRQLNKSIRPGCFTIGQSNAWRDHMATRYGSKWRDYVHYSNNGPGKIAPVARVRRDGSCDFRWTRGRSKAKWIPSPKRPGYLKATYPPIATGWTCPAEHLTCVDAYTPGDFHMFFDDPRTRENYIRWAPILLACEDWHHLRRLGKVGGDDDANEGADDE